MRLAQTAESVERLLRSDVPNLLVEHEHQQACRLPDLWAVRGIRVLERRADPPPDRLRRAGYTSYRWGENLGCRSGNPYSAVLGSHLYFQSERSYNGGHYRNLMDSRFHQVGIGVWVAGGRVRLVIDFYTP